MTRITRVLKVLVLLLLIVSVGYFARSIWRFDYYHDYNLLKRSIADTNCTIDHEIVNHDITLEEIDFKMNTPSGWKFEISFPDDRDMEQLCERPEGILFKRPENESQIYSIDRLNSALKEQNVELHTIRDILRNFDLIAPILRANYTNDEIPRSSQFSKASLTRYLWVLYPSKVSPCETLRTPELRLTATNERSEPGSHGLPLRRVDFDTITLNADGSVRSRSSLSAKCYLEDLRNGLTLPMVRIPAGQFLMGTTVEEATLVQAQHVQYSGKDFAEFWHESPPHSVSVPTFYMGMFEITQAQWRAVAALPMVNVELPEDPSEYKGDNRPVENMSWRQAVEFCDRLSIATGRDYRLPTEAEWEYACRAGTTTAYYFGNAITTQYSNYSGVYPYGSVGWGIDRDETIPVGALGAPNAFGLYDMHGNVGELCADSWHETYQGAPVDARVWAEDGDPASHPVRGGPTTSTIPTPALIRASSRRERGQDQLCWGCGFRIVASNTSR